MQNLAYAITNIYSIILQNGTFWSKSYVTKALNQDVVKKAWDKKACWAF